MDLKEFLLDVFPNKDEEKYTKMIDNLKSLGLDSVSDLKYLDEEAVKELNSFNRIEIKRLKDYLANFELETLEEILNVIFSGTQKDRIKEIKIFLNKHEVYARSDVLRININKMKAKEFFSESELMKIESFLGKDLIQALLEIFSGVNDQRISEIQKILKEHNITAKKDLIYIDTEKFRNGKILADIEVSKIETFLEENYKEQFLKNKEAKELEISKDLRHVLNEILFGTPTNRLEEIEEILKEEEIYSGKDILIADLNSFHLKESLSSAEMLKFEEYLKKTNVIHYEKLMSDRELEKSKNLKFVLKQIFLDTPEERLEEIEKILKKERIYSGLDLKIIDTNNLRREKSLPDIEILKIEEYIKKNNRERYEEIIQFKMTENERTFTKFKVDEEIRLFASKQMEEIKFMQLKSQEEKKMIEFKAEGEKLLREEENELKKAKAKEEMEQQNLKMQRQIELLEAKMKNEMEIEKIKMQREKELREAKAKEEMEREKINLQREKELREEKAKHIEREKELREAKAKEEMERENMKMQREKELMEARMKNEMEIEKINLQREKELREEKAKDIEREKELREAKAKEEMERENMKMQREKELMEARMKNEMEIEKIKMQREKELREAKAKEEMEREKINLQREKEVMEARAKEEMEREKIKMQKELNKKCCQSLINEKKDLLDDVRKLEKDCIRLKNVITENSQTGFKGFFTNSSVEKTKAEGEYEVLKKCLRSKNDRIADIDELLKSKAGF